MSKHHRGSVGRNFNNVIGSVRMWSLEISDNNLINPLAGAILARINQFAKDRASRLKLMAKPQQRLRDVPCLRSCQRTTPIPPLPGGVEIATMVSSKFTTRY